jgi:hypothetical protein
MQIKKMLVKCFMPWMHVRKGRKLQNKPKKLNQQLICYIPPNVAQGFVVYKAIYIYAINGVCFVTRVCAYLFISHNIFRIDQLVSMVHGTKTFPMDTKPVLLFFIFDIPFFCTNYRIITNLPSTQIILILIIAIILNKIIIRCVDGKLITLL